LLFKLPKTIGWIPSKLHLKVSYNYYNHYYP
jgi:hypothetical protein